MLLLMWGDNGVIDKDLKEPHRTVLPLNIKCKAKGKTAMKRGPILLQCETRNNREFQIIPRQNHVQKFQIM